ncbi:unnamed protein product, partial [Prorocentrum cordatum]
MGYTPYGSQQPLWMAGGLSGIDNLNRRLYDYEQAAVMEEQEGSFVKKISAGAEAAERKLLGIKSKHDEKGKKNQRDGKRAPFRFLRMAKRLAMSEESESDEDSDSDHAGDEVTKWVKSLQARMGNPSGARKYAELEFVERLKEVVAAKHDITKKSLDDVLGDF